MPGPTSKRSTATDTATEPPKATVFYVVKVIGEQREDVARSMTKADAEKHADEVRAQPGEAFELVIEERDGEY